MKKIIFLLFVITIAGAVGFKHVGVQAEGEYMESGCGHISQPILLPSAEGQLGSWATSDSATVLTDVDSLVIENRFFLISDYSYELTGVDFNNTWGCYFDPGLVPSQARVDEILEGYLEPFSCVHINLQGEISQWDPVDGSCRLEDIPNFWVSLSGGINTQEGWYDALVGGNLEIETESTYHVVPLAYGNPGTVAYFEVSGTGTEEPVLTKGTVHSSVFDDTTQKWKISVVLDQEGTAEMVSSMDSPDSHPDQIMVSISPYIRTINNQGTWVATVRNLYAEEFYTVFLPLIINQ